jgi:glycine/D-amino acid oxidase-like deaminating enzyme
MSSEGGQAGVQLVSGYHLSSVSSEDARNELLGKLVSDMRQVDAEELNRLFPEKFCHGFFYTTVVVDPRYYLKYLSEQFVKSGGKIVKKKIDNIQTDYLLDGFEVILNCTGFGAKKLLPDFKVTPIRGQTIKVRAPWIKHFYYADGAYIIPGADGLVTLGGIKEYYATNPLVDQFDHDSIWRRCTQLLPSLAKAEICWQWVGLRPFRQPVRVEPELLGNRRVVHNYGHGGNGVSLSWGTAIAATVLVRKFLQSDFSSKL